MSGVHAATRQCSWRDVATCRAFAHPAGSTWLRAVAAGGLPLPHDDESGNRRLRR